LQVAHTFLAVPEPALERLLDALAVDTENFADAAAASIRALTAAWTVGYLAIVARDSAPTVETPSVETPAVEIPPVEAPTPPPLPTLPVALTLPSLASFPDALRAFSLADARPFVRLVRDLAPATPSWRALEVGAALASAKSDKDVTRIARELVVVLPPWTDPLTIEANASLPSLESSDFRINGDVTGGYAWTKFGFLVHASYLTYDVESVGSSGVVTLTQTDAAEARFDPWFHIPLGRSVTLEIRPTIAASVYDTQRLGATREPFRDQSSTMFRGAAIAGIRVVPHPRLGLAALAGGGAQLELFDGVRLVRSRVTLTDETSSSGLVEGQLRMRYAVVPEWVSVRARGDLTYFRITRDDAVTTVARGTTLTTTSTSEYEQLEVLLRGFVDLDVLGFFMFRPSLHGGVNIVKVGDQTATVPVFGLGLRREAW
jgi:hypothetical protein